MAMLSENNLVYRLYLSNFKTSPWFQVLGQADGSDIKEDSQISVELQKEREMEKQYLTFLSQ